MSKEQSADEVEEEDRISRLEEEINRLKADVQSSSDEMTRMVEDLKRAVIDIRSAISEIENPFNLLRVITSEKDLEKIMKAQPTIDALKIERKEKDEASKPGGEELPEETVKAEDTAKKRERPSDLTGKIDLKYWSPNFKDGFSLIRWIYALLDIGFSKDDLKRICQCCEYIGVIPRNSSLCITGMIDVITDARSRGLSEEDIIFAIYMIADALGVKIEGERLRELAIHALKRNRGVTK
ncbi:MAG TPA: hypothetical protein ENG65_02080 [Candidatus Bathyarchaeota archaeon]|nr:hypothetical protein [Candidatus Bathyarchaeota archaeon]